jgi:capsular polysaccharide export protein
MKGPELISWPSRLARFIRDLQKTPQPAGLITERISETADLLLSLLWRPGRHTGNLVLLAGFEYEKRKVLRRLFPGHRLRFMPHWLPASWQLRVIERHGNCAHWVWSRRDSRLLTSELWAANTIVRFEDGFVRSNGLNVEKALSMSYTRDKTGLHFDSTRISDIEILLATADFSARSADILEAKKLIAFMHENTLSKYGRGPVSQYDLPPGSVLVLGQVEDDASVLANPDGLQTNVQLLNKALQENDPSRVFYRAHPDVSAGLRPARSNPEDLIYKEQIVPASVSISKLLQSKPLVYTISSLGGFEALAAGAQVKTFGGPFYAGWGLTEDYLTFDRRRRKLTVEEIFLIAYQDYAFYFDPRTGAPLTLRETLEFIASRLNTRHL